MSLESALNIVSFILIGIVAFIGKLYINKVDCLEKILPKKVEELKDMIRELQIDLARLEEKISK